jgi:hypothetical protein
MTEKRRANISKILINVGSIVFGTLVLPTLMGSFELVKLINEALPADTNLILHVTC